MKKIILLSISTLLVLSLQAQKFGFKVGLNLSGVNSSTNLADYQTAEFAKGLNGGFVFEFNPVKVIGIRAEALFSQKGYTVNSDVTVDGTDAVIKSSLNMNYLEIPLLLKIKLGPAYFTAGPYFSYAVSGKDIVTITVDGQKLAADQYSNYGQVPSNDVFKDGEFNGDNIKFSRTDMGLSAGAGIQFLKFFAEARYNAGLTNIENYSGMPVDEFIKNYTLSLSVGILFGK
ncbi:MAG: PorT family protein [Bacteroidales bacterium]|nr:PorT family protein [Bacteroidales bacterium]